MNNFEDFLLFPKSKPTICRICGIESANGQLLFNPNNDIQKLAVEICSFIFIKLKNIQKYPNWICSACHLQFESTTQFFELVRTGQQKMVELFGDPPKPGRKRKTQTVQSITEDDQNFCVDNEKVTEIEGKRITKPPGRLKDSMQGSELENLYSEIGIVKKRNRKTEMKVIGHIEDLDGATLGEMLSLPKSPTKTHTRYQCEYCQEKFSKETAFFDHVFTHKNILYECIECQETFPNKALYDQHSTHSNHSGMGIIESPNIEMAENSKANDEKSKSLDKVKTQKKNISLRFTCFKCPKSFMTKQAMKRHHVVHSEHRAFKCDECPARFKLKSTLRAHKRSHSFTRPYKCDRCEKAFTFKSSLRCHLRIHDGLRPYLCMICKKSFTQSGNLRDHKRTHTGERPFVCLICGTAFKTSSQCRYHQRTHIVEDIPSSKKLPSDQKTYECTKCGKTFKLMSGMRKHMRTHTGEKPYSCHLCPLKFSDPSNFKKHKIGHTITKERKNKKAQRKSLLRKDLSKIKFNPEFVLERETISIPENSPKPNKEITRGDLGPNVERSLMELLGEDYDTDSKPCGLLQNSTDPIITEIHNNDNSLLQRQLLNNQLVRVSYQDPMNPFTSKTTFYVVN